jgi:hypothetical protein
VRVVGIRAGVAERAALAEQVPAAIEFDSHLIEPALVCRQPVLVGAVALLAAAEPVFLGDQALDLVGDALVAHAVIVAPGGAAKPWRRIQRMPDTQALVDDVANELATWPGVHVGRRADGAALITYEGIELGVLHVESGVAELPVLEEERDELIEHGEAEEAEVEGVTHELRGPSDVTAVLDLFDRRYRDVRGEDDPYSSSDEG